MHTIAVTAALAALKFFGGPSQKAFVNSVKQVIKTAAKVSR